MAGANLMTRVSGIDMSLLGCALGVPRSVREVLEHYVKPPRAASGASGSASPVASQPSDRTGRRSYAERMSNALRGQPAP